MGDFIPIGEVALELKVRESKILSLASDSEINLVWQPRGFIHVYSVDMSTGEARYFDDKNPYPYEQPVDTLREGYFEIDLTLCPSWKVPLNDIKSGGKGYRLVFNPIDPLVIREIGPDGYIWSVTPLPEFDTGRDLDFPTIQTLGVFQKELDRYIKQLKHVNSRPKPDGKIKQRTNKIEQYLKVNNLLDRLNEDANGKNGLLDEVYEALKKEKMNNRTNLFPDKTAAKRPLRELRDKYINKSDS